jgi:glycerophosphoryl diester phosphodiesterase
VDTALRCGYNNSSAIRILISAIALGYPAQEILLERESIMVTKKPIYGILLGLAILVSIISVFLAVRAQRELAAAESELNLQLDLANAATLEAQTRAEELEAELREKSDRLEELEEAGNNACRDSNVRSIAHRGASDFAPENTLPAFQLAKELGFSCAEADIRFTADGVPVCLHDGSIDRTSNATGDIHSLTFEEVRQYDFGSWKSSDYAGTSIPTFEEYLSLCKNIGLHPYIELKEGTADQIRTLVDLVNRYGMRGKVSWISFDPNLLSAVRWYDEEARLGLLINYFESRLIYVICNLRSGKNDVFLDSSVFDEQVVNECRMANLPLEVWTINEQERLAALDPYISGVTSNCLRYGQFLYEAERG